MRGELGFKLKRPCAKCPFRVDCLEGWLSRGRASEIANSITREQRTFSCHETTEVGGAAPNREQHCAGALIMLENSGVGVGQFARIAARLGELDLDGLDMDAPVFSDIRDFVAHHEGEREAETCCTVDIGCEAPAGYLVGGSVVPNFHAPEGVTSPCDCCGEPVCNSCERLTGGRRLCGDCAE